MHLFTKFNTKIQQKNCVGTNGLTTTRTRHFSLRFNPPISTTSRKHRRYVWDNEKLLKPFKPVHIRPEKSILIKKGKKAANISGKVQFVMFLKSSKEHPL